MNELIKAAAGIRFSEPWWLVLLPLLALAAFAVRASRAGSRPTMLFPAVERLRAERFAANSFMASIPAALRWLSVMLAIVSLAGPRTQLPPSMAESRGIDIMLALDVSESMQQADFGGQSRFSAARDAAGRFIAGRPSDRIGLIAFSGGSYTLCPLTLDHDIVAGMLDALDAGVIREPGTAIGSAVLTAVNRLRASGSTEKVLLLLTDGENNAGAVGLPTAAKIAAGNGIRIYTVFTGKATSAGQAGLSAIGRGELEEAAAIGGGRMFRAGDASGLKSTFDDIGRLETTRLQSRLPSRTAELYPVLLVAAALCVLLEMALSSTRFMRIP